MAVTAQTYIEQKRFMIGMECKNTNSNSNLIQKIKYYFHDNVFVFTSFI